LVGDSYGLFGGLHPNDCGSRSKCFFSGSRHCGCHMIEDGGLIKSAGPLDGMTAGEQFGALLNGRLHLSMKFVAQFAAAFGAVTAGSVPGWTSVVTSGITTTTGTTTTTAEGQTVTWTTNGAAQPFSTALVVPLTVRWPYRAGAYGIVVSQTCSNPADETVWSTPAQPAVAGVPSPPLTPLATVCVLPARLAKSSTWPKRTTRTIERLCSTLR